METTLPAPPAEEVWLTLARSGSLYVSGGTPRLVALTDQAEDNATLRREIELLTGCPVTIEARVPLRANALGFTHAALLVPLHARGRGRKKPAFPVVIRRAWR